jgi:hypothetical protein
MAWSQQLFSVRAVGDPLQSLKEHLSIDKLHLAI